MCGSPILVILFVKYILRCFVANSLLLQLCTFLGKIVVAQKPVCVNKLSLSTSAWRKDKKKFGPLCHQKYIGETGTILKHRIAHHIGYILNQVKIRQLEPTWTCQARAWQTWILQSFNKLNVIMKLIGRKNKHITSIHLPHSTRE